MQFKKFAFFAILATLFFNGCSDSKETQNDEEKSQKVALNNKVFLTTTNNTVLSIDKNKEQLTVKELNNKVVLVNFFATWCAACKAEIPHLNNLRSKYNQDFEIVAVMLEQNKDPQELQEFIDKYKIQYPVTVSEANYNLAKLLGGVNSIPTMFMYDKKGNLLQKYVGIVPEEMIEMDIKKAIK